MLDILQKYKEFYAIHSLKVYIEYFIILQRIIPSNAGIP